MHVRPPDGKRMLATGFSVVAVHREQRNEKESNCPAKKIVLINCRNEGLSHGKPVHECDAVSTTPSAVRSCQRENCCRDELLPE